MSEECPNQDLVGAVADDEDEPQQETGYKPPAQKSLDEIQKLDEEDESLRKYKEALLAGANDVQADPNVPNVQVLRMTLLCDSAPNDIVLDLSEKDKEKLKKQSMVLKEGIEYRIKINFKVNRDIVSGLKYCQITYRNRVKVDKSDYMVGSYGPRALEHEFVTPVEEAPKGMLARGTYNIKSKFTDDDKHDHLSWEWTLSIKKDWTE